jgi:xylulokinase
MTGKLLVGVDIGTTASKGVLVDVDGNVLAYQIREHAVSTPRPGWCEMDADEVWWADLKFILRGLVAQSGMDPKSIACVCVSALSPNLLPLDENDVPLCKGVIYSDMRAVAEIKEITDRLGEDRILQLMGRRIPPDSVGAKVLWLRKNEPKIFEQTKIIHSASSYLVFKLTGVHVMDTLSANGVSPFYNPATLSWDEEICRELGISPDLFPPIKWTTEIAGSVTAEASRDTHLAEGTPVIVGFVDAPAESLSTGAVAPWEASLLYGTTMIMGIVVEPPKPGEKPLGNQMGVKGFYRTSVVMSSSGGLMRWFRDNFGQYEQEAEAKLGLSAYQLLAMGGESAPPGAEGLLVLPYFAGERSPIWDAQARGSVLGLTLSHSRMHIYRALVEATAFGLRHGLEVVQKTGVKVERVVSTGGGTKNHLWTQVVSDVLGRDQEILINAYGAPYGDAYLAGIGAGLFTDLVPLRDVWKRETRMVRWNPERKELYDRYFEVYRGLYDKLKDSMHALAELASLKV